jgi:hypothetical protein
MAGKDGRGYVDDPVRRAMKEQIEGSRKTYSTLEESSLPKAALTLMEKAKKEGLSSVRTTTRSVGDSYRSGFDCAYTENTGLESGGEKRTASDTPRPRSPTPSDDALSNTRYEHAHSNPYRFTRQPGNTVHAPTQANQAADPVHERFAASATGGFIYNYHTYDATSTYSGRPTRDGRWEVQHSSYLRRKPSSSSDPASSSSAASSSSSSSSSEEAKKPEKKKRKK